MSKEIHVNSYVKKDGTHVREHIRNVNSVGSFAPKQEPQKIILEENHNKTNPVLYYSDESEYVSPTVLTGGIEYDAPGGGSVDSGSSGSVGDIVSEVVKVISEVTPMVAQLVSALNSGNSSAAAYWQPQVNSKIKQINLKQNQVEYIIKEYSKKLAKTKNKEEYSKLYETLAKSNIPHRKLSSMVYAVNALANNGNYAQAATELENFKNSSTPIDTSKPYIQASPRPEIKAAPKPEIRSKYHPEIRAAYHPEMKAAPQNIIKQQYDRWNNDRKHMFAEYPEFQKQAIGTALDIMDIPPVNYIHDANNLWKIAADKFEHDSDYINANGMVIDSIEQLTPKVKDIVRQKLIQQIGKDNARGVFFNSTSTLAQGIGQSKEFQEYIVKNIDKLYNGEVIESGSTYFKSNYNLRLALGHADILFAQIDKDGNISAIIMDTYDFNEFDPDWKVHIAYHVQKEGLIENYYILIYVLIPMQEAWGLNTCIIKDLYD